MARVSVIVATYRRQQQLQRALISLARQTFRDMQIVLVDDNEDALWQKRVAQVTAQVREEYPDLNLQLIQNSPHGGSARARNGGIAAAQGTYITFLDDDDWFLPDKVEKQLAFMETSELDYSITDLWLYDEKGRAVQHRTRGYIRDVRPEKLLEYHLCHHMTGTDTLMFRRSYLLQIGGFAPIDIGDEFYLMLRAIEGGGKFGYLPDGGACATVHKANVGLSAGDGKRSGEMALYAFKKTYFHRLDSRAIAMIRARHRLTLAYGDLRNGKFFQGMVCGAAAFFTAPRQCLCLLRYIRWGKGRNRFGRCAPVGDLA